MLGPPQAQRSKSIKKVKANDWWKNYSLNKTQEILSRYLLYKIVTLKRMMLYKVKVAIEPIHKQLFSLSRGQEHRKDY